MNYQSAFPIQPFKKTESDQRSVRNRLQFLLGLKDGWLNGEGNSLSALGLEQFANAFEKYFNTKLPIPYLFPTPDGNVQAEWSISNFDITLKVDLSDQTAFYQVSSDQNEETDETTLNLAQPAGWQQLVEKLIALSKV